jgi:hypothetical protein
MKSVLGIAQKAEQLGIMILNTEKIERARHCARMIEKKRAEALAKKETKQEPKAQPAPENKKADANPPPVRKGTESKQKKKGE